MPARSRRPQPHRKIDPPALAGVHLESFALDELKNDFRCEQRLVDEAAQADVHAASVVFDSCEIKRSALERSVLARIRLIDLRLERSNASNAKWEGARLRRVEIIRCRLTGLSLAQAECHDLMLQDCKGDFLVLAGSKIKNARFEDCILAETDFARAQLDNVVFSNCDLRNANFESARLNSVDVRGSALDGIRLEASQLSGLTIDPTQALTIVHLLGATIA